MLFLELYFFVFYPELSFDIDVYPCKIEVWETYNPGAVVKIMACDNAGTDVDSGKVRYSYNSSPPGGITCQELACIKKKSQVWSQVTIVTILHHQVALYVRN